MPTLGFLKKKRTKDSSGSRDLDSPASPVKDASSSLSPTLSKTNDFLTQPKSTPQSDQPAPSQTQSPLTSAQNADSMNTQTYQQQSGSQNIPSISNLIHPSNQNSSQEYETQQMKAENGGAVAPGETHKLIPRTTKGKYTLNDFTIQRTLGTGSFGRVHLVQSKHNQRFYAVKVLKKHQVVKMKQVEHTNDERRMLAQVKHPFLITLWGTFQDSKNLYMVMDFVEGGELFSLLRKSQVHGCPYQT
jgi:protein kinase A